MSLMMLGMRICMVERGPSHHCLAGSEHPEWEFTKTCAAAHTRLLHDVGCLFIHAISHVHEWLLRLFQAGILTVSASAYPLQISRRLLYHHACEIKNIYSSSFILNHGAQIIYCMYIAIIHRILYIVSHPSFHVIHHRQPIIMDHASQYFIHVQSCIVCVYVNNRVYIYIYKHSYLYAHMTFCCYSSITSKI